MICVNSVNVSPSSITITVGEWYYDASAEITPANAECKSVTWSSDDPTVASVNEITGYIYGVSEGTTTIRATACDGSGCCDTITVNVRTVIPVESITLSACCLNLEIGETATLTATKYPANANYSKGLVWFSLKPNIATVSNGTVTAVANGTTQIGVMAIDGGGARATCAVTVTGGVPVSSVNIVSSVSEMFVGDAIELSATVYPSNASNQYVTWSSNNPGVASVSSSGVVTGVSAGNATIYATAQDNSGANDSFDIIVNPITACYNIINKASGKAVNIEGKYIIDLENRHDVILYEQTGSNEQIWKIDTISEVEKSYVKSYVDDAFALNINTSTKNCDVIKVSGNDRDAAVRFILQENGYYKIKLANYDLYLTAAGIADESNIKWSKTQENDLQLWSLNEVNIDQLNAIREAEKKEYHLVCQANISKALKVEESDDSMDLCLERRSYINKQKWRIKGTATSQKIVSQFNNDYILCNDGSNAAIVSDNSTDTNSDLTITQYGSDTDLYEIKQTNSELYLTLSGDDIIWSNYDINNHSAQLWNFIAKPDNIHNGCDTAAKLIDTDMVDEDRTIRAVKLGGEEFVMRYYASDKDHYKVLTKEEGEYLHRRGLKIVSVFQNSGNNESYFSSISGTQDATAALERATEAGQREGTVIYFAVDDDVDPSVIEDYFLAIKDKINGRYKIGVYGSGAVCSRVKQILKCEVFSFLAGATGWRGYNDYDNTDCYNIKQAEPIFYNGVEFNDNTAVNSDYGQW